MNTKTLIAISVCAIMIMGGFLALADSSPGNVSGNQGLLIHPDTSTGTVNTTLVYFQGTEEYLSANANVLSGTVNHIYVWSYVNSTSKEDLLNEYILINGVQVANLANKDVRTPDFSGAWGLAQEWGLPSGNPINYSLNP